MPKADKIATVAEITDKFRTSNAAVVTEYRGLTMAQLTELRRSLGKDTAYTVAKNTLVKRAAADAGVSGIDDMFIGPTAVAFIGGEPVDAAKALRDFAKAHPLLVIKGGLLDGRKLEAAEVSKLADLESRDVLLAKMAGAMLATLTKAAYVFNALPSQVARLAAALQEKRAEAGETLEAAAVVEDAIVEVAVAEVAAIEEATDEIVAEAVVETEAVIEEAAAEVAVVEAIVEEAVAEDLDAGDLEAAEADVAAAAEAEDEVVEEAAAEVAAIEAVAEGAVETAAEIEEAVVEEAVTDAVAVEAAAADIADEVDQEPGSPA